MLVRVINTIMPGDSLMQRPKILIFSSMLPYPVDRGDKNRLYHILKLLMEFSDIRLISIEREWEPKTACPAVFDNLEIERVLLHKNNVYLESVMDLLKGQPMLAYRYNLPVVSNTILTQIKSFQPDIFWGFQISAYPFLDLVKDRRVILDLVDCPSRVVFDSRKSSTISINAKLFAYAQMRIIHYEKQALIKSDKVLVNSAFDKKYLEDLHSVEDKVVVINNCVPEDLLKHRWKFDVQRPPRLLFVGNFNYSPNKDGIRNFIRNIWPLIKEKKNDAEFIICGVGFEKLAKELGFLPGIRWMGFVTDLISIYLSSSLLIVPLSIVGGIQYKLIEGLALGLPTVTTPGSAELCGMLDNHDLLVGQTNEELAEKALSILQDPGLAMRLSNNAREAIARKFTWEKQRDLLISLTRDG